jgi:hypothetical protein
MPAPEFRKKAIFFVTFAGIVTLIIVLLLPFAEGLLQAYVLKHFGIAITSAGYSIPKDVENPPGVMIET